ncbi:TetR family transcriptional regulator [Streptomyces griseoloalbus]|uniref:TetR family transcriptional regulator n=1 Tax=Streptomyces griseoloalbus TaxID=67303 RepID=A0ABV3E0I4_9ACTN
MSVSACTAWRCFPTKESCVRPLFSTGIDTVATALRQRRPDQPLQEAFEHMWTTGTLMPRGGRSAEADADRAKPGLRAVWPQTHDEAEPAFARARAERAGLPAGNVRPAIWAAMLNAALRTAVERHAYRTTEPGTDPATEPGTDPATEPGTDPATDRADLRPTLSSALAVTAAGLT